MTEFQHQVALFQWAKKNEARLPELSLLHSIPMGEFRSQKQRTRVKMTGGKAGIPDICLPVARKGWHGLYIELKIGKNKPAPKQAEWLDALTEQGYLATVCYDWLEAVEVIEEYLIK